MIADILQPTHLLIVLVVALVVLGPKRLPDAGRALGQGLREFKTSITADHETEPTATQASIGNGEKTPVTDTLPVAHLRVPD